MQKTQPDWENSAEHSGQSQEGMTPVLKVGEKKGYGQR